MCSLQSVTGCSLLLSYGSPLFLLVPEKTKLGGLLQEAPGLTAKGAAAGEVEGQAVCHSSTKGGQVTRRLL